MCMKLEFEIIGPDNPICEVQLKNVRRLDLRRALCEQGRPVLRRVPNTCLAYFPALVLARTRVVALGSATTVTNALPAAVTAPSTSCSTAPCTRSTAPSTSNTAPSTSTSTSGGSTRCVLVAAQRVFLRCSWQAQCLVTPASVLGESVWSGVAGRFGVFPRGVLRSRVLRCGSWLGRAMQRADPRSGAQCSVRFVVRARNAACGSWLGRVTQRADPGWGAQCSVRILVGCAGW